MSYYVYFIQADRKRGCKPGPIKIGYSSNPDDRLRKLQTGNAEKLVLRLSLPFEEEDKAKKMERTLHWLAGKKGKRLKGEWFMVYGSWKYLISESMKMARL